VHETPMPNVGDELHRYGWNRCSSACHGPDRSHLIVPGFRSSLRLLVPAAQEHARLVRVRRAERIRAGLRPRGRRCRAVRPAHPFLGPREADARADRRPRRKRLAPVRIALAPRPRRGRGLRRRGAVERDVALPSRERILERRPHHRSRRRPTRRLAVPRAGGDQRPRPVDGRQVPLLRELAPR
jgi:hypothetical protein